jgi:hypothetical protein
MRLARLITVLVLPSGVWRVCLALGLPMGIRAVAGVSSAGGLVRGWQAAPILSLTALSECVALLSLGLVRPWGEVFWDRLPFVGGRRVSPVAATAAAGTGAVILTVLWIAATVNFFRLTVFGAPRHGFVFVNGWWEALFIACYVPLLLWGPLLLVLARAYYRRRCGG